MTDHEWVIPLDFAKPPPGMSANHRVHWRVANNSTKLVRTLVLAEARRQRIPVSAHLEVRLVWVVKDRQKRDDDNLQPFAKACWDGLAASKGISAHLVPDDSPEYVTKHHPRIEYQKGATPHFEIRLTTKESTP
ncbi:hypothetical protein O1W71_02150 [Microbacterium sp. H37-C3]|uniref:hypothetical protein n=1 Tax=Microbacterium sp. H37-C3 TaxID=3004354 RepID=UPI0022AE71D7|nr:hypothetical protein [Microbacterium sp. H37-C3]MCZ4066470.1 hypothetical protein [Microbacterium sp. H37-C3]